MKIFTGIVFVYSMVAFPVFSQNADSLELALEITSGPEKVKTYNELFRAHLQTDPIKAIEYSRKALQLATEINDKKGIGASYNNLGVAYKNQGALEKALEYYLVALAIYEELKNDEGVGTLKNNIANIYIIKKNYGQAKRYLEESFEIFTRLNDKFRMVGSMNNLGNLNMELKLQEKAMKNFMEAYQLSKEMAINYPDPITNIGNIYYEQGNYQQALQYYREALTLEKLNQNKIGEISTLTNIGIVHLKSGQYQKAEQYLKDAKTKVEQTQSFSYLPPIYKHNSEILFKEGKNKEAYLSMVTYDSLREILNGEESTRKIAQMEMAIDFQKKENELEILQKEDEIKTLQLRNSRLFIVLTILSILLFIGAVNLYFMGSRKKLFKT